MDKHIRHDIEERLEGFPEERIPELIDYIESRMQPDKANIKKRLKTLKQEYFPEAGP
jgi:hypothetical protein